jgi:hypothetical protein
MNLPLFYSPLEGVFSLMPENGIRVQRLLMDFKTTKAQPLHAVAKADAAFATACVNQKRRA